MRYIGVNEDSCHGRRSHPVNYDQCCEPKIEKTFSVGENRPKPTIFGSVFRLPKTMARYVSRKSQTRFSVGFCPPEPGTDCFFCCAVFFNSLSATLITPTYLWKPRKNDRNQAAPWAKKQKRPRHLPNRLTTLMPTPAHRNLRTLDHLAGFTEKPTEKPTEECSVSVSFFSVQHTTPTESFSFPVHNTGYDSSTP